MTQDTYTVPRLCMRPFEKKNMIQTWGKIPILFMRAWSRVEVYTSSICIHIIYVYVNICIICICRYTHTGNIDVHKKVLYVLTNTNTDGACPKKAPGIVS
jgi:hypothetical protein